MISGLSLFVWKGGLAGFVKGVALSGIGTPFGEVVRRRIEPYRPVATSLAHTGVVVISTALAYKWSATDDPVINGATVLTSLAGSYIGSQMNRFSQPVIASAAVSLARRIGIIKAGNSPNPSGRTKEA